MRGRFPTCLVSYGREDPPVPRHVRVLTLIQYLVVLLFLIVIATKVDGCSSCSPLYLPC
jgi:hypothetical protein